jgi:putative phage-type endonuclease
MTELDELDNNNAWRQLLDWRSLPQDETWLAERKTGIGGSDVAALVGIDKYRSRWDVYWSKVETEQDRSGPPSEAALWGTLMQEVIGQEWARRAGVGLSPGKLTRMAGRPHVLGTPDFLTLEGPQRVVEVKAVGNWAFTNDWGNGAHVPGYYLCQVQWYLAVTGLESAIVVALVAGARLHTFEVQRDQAAIVQLLAAADEFWSDHVQARKAPEPDGKMSTRKAIEARYAAPEYEKRTILPEEGTEAIREYLSALELKREWSKRADAASNLLRKILGEAEADEAALPGREVAAVTWKRTRSLDMAALLASLTDEQKARYCKLSVDVADLELELGPGAIDKFRVPGDVRRLYVNAKALDD